MNGGNVVQLSERSRRSRGRRPATIPSNGHRDEAIPPLPGGDWDVDLLLFATRRDETAATRASGRMRLIIDDHENITIQIMRPDIDYPIFLFPKPRMPAHRVLREVLSVIFGVSASSGRS